MYGGIMTLQAFSVHAHFYQPPREDPLTGVIPKEAGAAPYSNWNERIHAECYRPNAELHNFERISFNIGPTLAGWMQSHDPTTLRQIVAQDRANQKRFGVGNAMAQAYNHTILPLASYLDKVTQVYWGIADFAFRFGRAPQGLWLPETAVDSETLEVLARFGIQYTILAPWQAATDDLDITEPYTVTVSNGSHVAVFFYQRELSARVSFDPSVTMNADSFARDLLLSSYKPEKTVLGQPQILLVASDGELYGHHQSLRQHFLKHLVNGASAQFGLSPVYPALWLKDHPPRQSIKIREHTSWSCHHGVTRWMDICGCTPNDGAWKAELRGALEELAQIIDQVYLDAFHPLVANPWGLRDRYIHVILGQLTFDQLLGEMTCRTPSSEERLRIHLLLESQRERQRMFTSCGWFFEDFDRIEPRNNVAYAAQAVRLVKRATGIDLESQAMQALSGVISPISGLRADRVFQGHIRRTEGISEPQGGYAD
jgi:alpha-amylase/alpha-mannosidase (GH57 family)